MDGPSKNGEVQSVQESTLTRVIHDKETMDLKDRIAGLKYVIASSICDFYQNCISGDRGVKDQIHFGDYGFVDNYVNNYILDLFFRCGDYKTKTGEALTVDNLRKTALESDDSTPELIYAGKGDSKAKIYFFNGRESCNFNTSIVGVSDELRKEMMVKFSDIPAIKWIETINEAVNRQRGFIATSCGIYEITAKELQGIEMGEDLKFFIKALDLVFQEKGETLGNINDPLDNNKEGTRLVVGSYKDRATFLIEPQSGQTGGKMVNLSVLLDTEKMSGRTEADRFVVSKTATEIMDLLDESGIQVSNHVLNYISEGSLHKGEFNPEFNNRYGNGYAEVTRLLSYCVRLEDRQEIIKKLFSSFSDSGWEKIKDKKDRLTGPSKVFFEMINDLIDPNRKQKKSDYAYHKSEFAMRDGTCRDIEYYYEVAYWENESLRDKNFFYQKTYSSGPSAITRREIVVDGVRLPKGFLCRVCKEGVEPLRPTMFCFSKDEAIDAYGKQYQYIYENTSKRLGRLIEINNEDFIF